MTPKEFLQEKGIHPQEPIHWYGENEFLTLDNLMQEYTDKQLILHGVINWVAFDKEKPPVEKEVMFYENDEIYTSTMDKHTDVYGIDGLLCFPDYWAEKPKPPCL